MEPNSLKWVGSPCGLHGPYIFYKAFKFHLEGKPRILSLGDFFFVRCKPGDPICIAELQLLWEERTTKQLLSSSKLYFLPEDTPQGRTVSHGEDEIIAVSEKVIVKLDNLVKWTVWDVSEWTCGLRSASLNPSILKERGNGQHDALHKYRDSILNGGLNFKDVLKEKAELGEDEDSKRVLVLSYPQYCRYRSISARLREQPSSLLTDPVILALGGTACLSGSTRILYCRETFEHPTLIHSHSISEEFAPNLKGRPRKKKAWLCQRREGWGSGWEASSLETAPPAQMKADCVTRPKSSGGCKRPLLEERSGARAEGRGGPEQAFLVALYKYMKERNTPIERIPYLGFKQINLWTMFQAAQKLGGYDLITARRQWKNVYDELGSNPGSTSAATCTRRHYERLILPYERFIKGEEDKPLPPVKPRKQDSATQEGHSRLKTAGGKCPKVPANQKPPGERDASLEGRKLSEVCDGKEGTGALELQDQRPPQRLLQEEKEEPQLTVKEEAVCSDVQDGRVLLPNWPCERGTSKCNCGDDETPTATPFPLPLPLSRTAEAGASDPAPLPLSRTAEAGASDPAPLPHTAEAGASDPAPLPLPRTAEAGASDLAPLPLPRTAEAFACDPAPLPRTADTAASDPAPLPLSRTAEAGASDLAPLPLSRTAEAGASDLAPLPLPLSRTAEAGASDLAPLPLPRTAEAFACDPAPLPRTADAAASDPAPLPLSRTAEAGVSVGRVEVSGSREAQSQVGLVLPMLKQRAPVEPEEPCGLSPTPALYPSSAAAMSPLAKKKLLSQVSGMAAPSRYSFAPPPGTETAAVARPSVIQHAHSFKPRTPEDRKQEVMSEHLPSPRGDVYLQREAMRDVVEREADKPSPPPQELNFHSRYYPHPLHCLHHPSQQQPATYPHREVLFPQDGGNGFCFPPNLHSDIPHTLGQEEREVPSDDQPTDLSLPKPSPHKLSYSKPVPPGPPCPTDSLDCLPKACRVPPMSFCPARSAADPPMRRGREGGRPAEDRLRPAFSSRGSQQREGPARPLRSSLQENGPPERKIRAVTPLHPAEDPARTPKTPEPEGERERKGAGPPLLGVQDSSYSHKFPLHSPVFPGLYPRGLLSQPQDVFDGLGSPLPVGGYPHPLQGLKAPTVLSPLLPPFAIHSFMMQRQLLASTTGPAHVFPAGASYRHFLYPPPAFSTSQLSPVHPSTKL
ncbi:AT-rich interactive domain-containing protein 5B-like [Megalops cyprinoides]|uniref:AT-rich interactive domain-containing protein 5B-like n=1 Tax=Megalops cyprinoides TaxID=118141 RepID=UPI0018651DC1|nr:AT-rich interactive domain-containing protein 5B-like [Megalops cyprinoides]